MMVLWHNNDVTTETTAFPSTLAMAGVASIAGMYISGSFPGVPSPHMPPAGG